MSRASRGGLTLKSGKIGRVNCIRQQMTMPGERINMSLDGSVRLESLRERDVFRINAHLGIFYTPLRWIWPEFPQYLREGPDTAVVSPTIIDKDWAKYGIGCYGADNSTSQLDEHWKNAVLRIYNEWYKWPEDPDATEWEQDGNKAVPLSKNWSRCRYEKNPSTTTLPVTTGVDVRDLAETQARFRSAMKREILAYQRWIELVDEMYKGDGSREVDQVPIMIDQVEVGVNPRDLPATDGPSLGQWQSLYDFKIDHQVKGFTAPEHGIISYMLTVRFGSVIEGRNPLGYENNWEEKVADPEYITIAQPQEVFTTQVAMTDVATSLGYLPAGWQWRSDHDVIGARIDELDSFPYMRIPTTKAEAKDATRVKNAFRSQKLGDYVVDCYIKEECVQPIGDTLDSYMSGMLDHTQPGQRKSGDEFPKGGKML